MCMGSTPIIGVTDVRLRVTEYVIARKDLLVSTSARSSLAGVCVYVFDA